MFAINKKPIKSSNRWTWIYNGVARLTLASLCFPVSLDPKFVTKFQQNSHEITYKKSRTTYYIILLYVIFVRDLPNHIPKNSEITNNSTTGRKSRLEIRQQCLYNRDVSIKKIWTAFPPRPVKNTKTYVIFNFAGAHTSVFRLWFAKITYVGLRS